MALPDNQRRRRRDLTSPRTQGGAAWLEVMLVLCFTGPGIIVGLWLADLPSPRPADLVQDAWKFGPLVVLLLAHVAHLRGKLEALSKQDGLNRREQERLDHIVRRKLTTFTRILVFYLALSAGLVVLSLVPEAAAAAPHVTLAALGGLIGLSLYLVRLTWAEIRAVNEFVWMMDRRKIGEASRKQALSLFKRQDPA